MFVKHRFLRLGVVGHTQPQIPILFGSTYGLEAHCLHTLVSALHHLRCCTSRPSRFNLIPSFPKAQIAFDHVPQTASLPSRAPPINSDDNVLLGTREEIVPIDAKPLGNRLREGAAVHPEQDWVLRTA